MLLIPLPMPALAGTVFSGEESFNHLQGIYPMPISSVQAPEISGDQHFNLNLRFIPRRNQIPRLLNPIRDSLFY